MLAAEQDDDRAQRSVGLAYMNGNGVEENETAAIHWWTLAANQGNQEAQKDLMVIGNYPTDRLGETSEPMDETTMPPFN